MKWLFFSILLVNVALYLWATGHPQNTPDAARAALGQVNSRAMVLLEEREATATSGRAVCMRIGPFLTQATFADASRRLSELGLEYDKTAVSARQLKTWRVYAELPESQEELTGLRDTLDSMGIEHYRFEDNGLSYLSLGRLYSQSDDARVFVGTLNEQGIEATFRPELRTLGPLRWIEVDEIPDRFAREQLQATEWGDAMAAVTTFPCAD